MHSHRLRNPLLAVLMILSVLALTVIAPSRAFAASCYDATCKGKNPSTQGCGADAYTMDSFVDDPLYVELRYSPACHAAWTRVSTPSGTQGAVCNTEFAQIRGYDAADVRKGVYGVQAVCPGQTFTVMWPFSDWVRACLSYTWFDGDPYVCTARH